MKKITAMLAAALVALTLCSCSDKKNESSNSSYDIIYQKTTAPETEPTTEEETLPPRKKVADSDYFGKWIPEKIILGEDIYDMSYKDIELKYLYQLEISEDGTAVMGHAIPESEKSQYNWQFLSGMIEMNGELESTVYGSMPYDDLILTDGENIKIYMVHTDEFEELSEAGYEAALEYNGNVDIPELSIEKNDVSPVEFVGKWECCFYEIDGLASRDEMYGIPLDALFRIEITSDGNAKFFIGGGDVDAVETDYTWSLYSNGCAGLFEDGESIGIVQIKKGELYLDEGNSMSRYKKVDEFTDFDWSSLAEE